MLDRIGSATPGDASIYRAAQKVSETDRGSFSLRTPDGVPASPPPEVLDALSSAQRVDEELRSRGLNVAFDVQDGDVRVHLVDEHGAVVHDLAPSHALAAFGGETPVAEILA